jgi:hypothetical protein
MDSGQIADRLIDCEQRLASLPETTLRLEEATAENAALRMELDSARTALHQITASTSWRLTDPLRRLQRLIDRH